MKKILCVENTPWIVEWDFEKNCLNPATITYGSTKKVWWLCDKGHSWESTVNNRTKPGGNGCPYCSGHKVCDDNCLATLRPGLTKEWHPTKNGKIFPEDVTLKSSKVVWWICEKGHEWKAAVHNRTSGNGCPYCKNKLVCLDNCLMYTHKELLVFWDYKKNSEFGPDKVTFGSTKSVWWKCEYGHSWSSTVNKMSSGEGCPYCSGHRVCEGNRLSILYPEIVKEWHPRKNKNLTPDNVTYGSGKKVWWICKEGHEWLATICDRVRGRGCLLCSKGPVSKISQQWLDLLNIPQECREFLISELNYKVDAFVPETNTVYEFFGDYWHGNPERFDRTQEHPVCGKTFGELYEEAKTRIIRLEEAGYKVVYIWENDYLRLK